jgi:hypothetical protein
VRQAANIYYEEVYNILFTYLKEKGDRKEILEVSPCPVIPTRLIRLMYRSVWK